MEYIDDLRAAIREAKIQFKCAINAMVVLPGHLHAVLTLADSSDNYSALWQKIKASFTRRFVRAGFGLKKNMRGKFNLWQSRFGSTGLGMKNILLGVCGLYSLQSCKTRIGYTGGGLACFNISPVRTTKYIE
ncbi:MAG TPA: transposase [Cellvibrionaceae bacterium]